LTQEKIYTLRLKPSEQTRRLLRDNENEDRMYLYVRESELEEVQAGK
jgi:hypothetical protein